MIRLGHLTKREGYMPDQLESIIESPEAQLLKDGFVFTEGPLWHPDGYWLFAVSYTHLTLPTNREV